MEGFIKGIKAYYGAFQLISQLKLWKFFAIPVIISIGIGLTVVTVLYFFSESLSIYLSSLWPWETGSESVSVVSGVIAVSLILILGLISFKYIVLAVAAPFMGPISKRIEDHFTGGNSVEITSSSFQLFTRGVRISIRNLFRELILTIPILLFGLIPLIGIFSTVLLFLMQAYFAGFGNMDYTLERHFNYKDSVRFVKRNRGSATGNGVVFMLFLLIPFIGVILVLPLSVTAAATETIQLIYKEKDSTLISQNM